MSILKWLSFPFSILYWSVTTIRNVLYDNEIFKSKTFDVKVICVGNLSVGGTGKSPMIEYLIENLKENHRIAVLSRGYKRKTKGFHEVSIKNTAAEVGDEPLQFKRKFPEQVICVDADRRNGITRILKTYTETDIILLDDAFQHRKVKADYNILLTTFDRPYFKDYLLPMGRLRESRAGTKRAHSIIVTKCPSTLSEHQKNNYKQQIKLLNHQHLGFSNIKYSKNVKNDSSYLPLSGFDDFILITGIANPKPLLDFLNEHQKTYQHHAYPDHYHFSEKDIEQFKTFDKPILTTEKDHVRLRDSGIEQLYYLPITIQVDIDLISLIEND
jgi:tetraacyldisaccharide 4'-kinase